MATREKRASLPPALRYPPRVRDLLLGIARCRNIDRARCSSSHPCHAIVTSQVTTGEVFQLPEPWNGRLAEAPLLFVSSNPTIGTRAEFPRDTWDDEVIEDFFVNRFGEGMKPWTKGGNRALLADGSHAKANHFWSSIRKRAVELFERAVVPGLDYALTEVVRCKSDAEYGVREAAGECAGRYLLPTFEASEATLIVTLGRVAEEYLRKIVKFDGPLSSPTMIGGRDRVVAVLPHPNAHEKRTFLNRFDERDLAELRRRLRA